MQTLYTGLNSINTSTYQYGNLSNLIRVCKFNQQQFIERVMNTSYRLPHEHALVQLVEFMQINPDWTIDELEQVIQFKTERWASNANATGVYNSGRLKENVVYYQQFNELLISLPPQSTFTECLATPPELLCPFIPVYSESTELDFRPVKDKPTKGDGNKLAIIGIDFQALAVGYWMHLRNSRAYMLDPKPEVWLPKYPLMNCTLLGNRLVILNALYEHITTGRDPEDLVTVPRTTYAINSVEPTIKRTVELYNELYQRTPLKNLESLLNGLVTLDTLPDDKLNPVMWKDPMNYEMYLRSRWVWNFAYMKALTVLFHYNRITSTRNSYLEDRVKAWLRQDVRLSTQQIKNPWLENRFLAMRNELERVL